MRNLRLFATAATAAVAAATNVQAAHVVVFDRRAEVNVSASTHRGPQVFGSGARIVNGNVVSGAASEGGSWNAGPTTPGATTVWAEGTQTGWFTEPLASYAWGSASLDRGELKGVVDNSGPNTFGSPLGYAYGLIYDTLYFDNTTGGDVALTLTYAFDGLMSDPYGGGPAGTASLILGGCGGCGSGFTPIRFLDGTAAGGANRAYFNLSGVYHFNDSRPVWDTWIDPSGIGGSISTTLLIPTGQTSLGIGADLEIDCRGGSDCDFANTGAFRLGAVPNGLTWRSESGVLLSGLSTGAIPEPSTWAVMIVGFGLAGAALRRRAFRTT